MNVTIPLWLVVVVLAPYALVLGMVLVALYCEYEGREHERKRERALELERRERVAKGWGRF